MDLEELHYLWRVKLAALGTQSEWWCRVVRTGRWTMMLLRWNPTWKLWVYNCRPLAKLEWDLEDFMWKHGGRLRHFFDYNTNWVGLYNCCWTVPYAMVGGHWASQQGNQYVLGSLASPCAWTYQAILVAHRP